MLTGNRQKQTNVSVATRYALVAGSIVLTTLLRLSLNPLLGRKAALIVYFPALVLGAWLGGWGGGLFALVLSTLAAIYFFISPKHSLLITSSADQLTLLVFFLVGLSVSAISSSQRLARRQAEDAYGEAQQAAEDAKRRGQALEESESRYRHLLETANEGVVSTDADDAITYVNPRLAEMLGRTPQSLIGHPIYDLLFKEDTDKARARRSERRQGVQEQYELRMRHESGTEVWAVANVSVLFDGDRYTGTFGLLTDITERRRTESELQSAYTRLSLVNLIGEAVRGSSDPQAILQTTAAALGQTIGADRCYYVTYNIDRDQGTISIEWHAGGLSSIAGDHRISEYAPNHNPLYLAGKTDVVEDAFALSDTVLAVRLGLRSLVRVPLSSGGVMTALVVAMAHQPRRWTQDEVALVETVAAQTKAAVEEARSKLRERGFLRDVLASVTEGKLLLSTSPAQLPALLTPLGEEITLTQAGGPRELRMRAQAAAQRAGHSEERQHDLVTAVSEAGMNAIVHGGGGRGRVSVGGDGTVQVRVEDQGSGIAVENLPRATLSRGFTTAGTLGHGLKMMLETADRLSLLTGPGGTTLVLEQERDRPLPAWL